MQSLITNTLKSRINEDTPIDEIVDIFKEVLEPLRGEEEYYVCESIVLPHGETFVYYFSLSLDTTFEEKEIQYRIDLKYEATAMTCVLHNLRWSDRVDDFWGTIKNTHAFKYLKEEKIKPFVIEILDWYI